MLTLYICMAWEGGFTSLAQTNLSIVVGVFQACYPAQVLGHTLLPPGMVAMLVISFVPKVKHTRFPISMIFYNVCVYLNSIGEATQNSLKLLLFKAFMAVTSRQPCQLYQF